jgi:hypothetical protein
MNDAKLTPISPAQVQKFHRSAKQIAAQGVAQLAARHENGRERGFRFAALRANPSSIFASVFNMLPQYAVEMVTAGRN